MREKGFLIGVGVQPAHIQKSKRQTRVATQNSPHQASHFAQAVSPRSASCGLRIHAHRTFEFCFRGHRLLKRIAGAVTAMGTSNRLE